MEPEDKDKEQMRSSKFTPQNQRERIARNEKNQDRVPLYRAVKDENGYQVRPQGQAVNRPATQSRPFAGGASKRPRINDGQNTNRYKRQTPQTADGRTYQRTGYSTGNQNNNKTGQKPSSYSSHHTGNRTPYARRPGDAKYSTHKNTNNFNTANKFKFVPPKIVRYEEALDPNAPIRLNKYLANAGVCSRREADEFIKAGVVKVNNEVITELGKKISRSDNVMFHDRPIHLEGKIYILLNKPKNFVTTTDDPGERHTVMELVKRVCKERVYPVGRLDRNTTGVLLLTNDGDLASKLTHPSYKKKKIYHVWLDKEVEITDMERLANGIELEDGEIHADALSYASEEDKCQVGIEIHSGRNRIVRRMFEFLGYKVIKLDRVYFAGLTKKNLGRGKWRYLSEKEVNMLRMGAFE